LSDPAGISGCILWLKAGTGIFKDAGTTPAADGDGVAQWNDASGNGKNFTQTTSDKRPKWNTTDQLVEGVYFSVTQFLSHATFSYNWQAGSFFAIGRQSTLRDSGGNTPSSSQSFHNIVSNQVPTVLFGYAGTTADGETSGQLRKAMLVDGAFKVGSVFLPTNLSLYGFAGGAGSFTLITNETSDSVAASSVSTTTGLNIISSLNNVFSMWGGISEVVAYDHQLNGTEIALMQTYAQSVGVVFNPLNIISFDGDSITAGLDSPLNRGWVRQLSLPGKTSYQFSMGRASVTLATLLSERPTFIDPFIIGGKRNVLVIFAGTNDITSGSTAAATYANLVSYCQGARSAGWNKICVVTMLPRTDLAVPASRTTYNTLIRNNALTDWDALGDWGGNATMGQDGDDTNPTYYSDGIHPTTVGHGIGAGIISTALLTLLQSPSGSNHFLTLLGVG